MVEKRGLADPGRATDEQRAASSRPGGLEQLIESLALPLPAVERDHPNCRGYSDPA
jgi:hypothetical protein